MDDVATSTIEGLGWAAPTASRDDEDDDIPVYAVARRLSPRSRRRERDSALPGLDASAEQPGLFDQP